MRLVFWSVWVGSIGLELSIIFAIGCISIKATIYYSTCLVRPYYLSLYIYIYGYMSFFMLGLTGIHVPTLGGRCILYIYIYIYICIHTYFGMWLGLFNWCFDALYFADPSP